MQTMIPVICNNPRHGSKLVAKERYYLDYNSIWSDGEGVEYGVIYADQKKTTRLAEMALSRFQLLWGEMAA